MGGVLFDNTNVLLCELKWNEINYDKVEKTRSIKNRLCKPRSQGHLPILLFGADQKKYRVKGTGNA